LQSVDLDPPALHLLTLARTLTLGDHRFFSPFEFLPTPE